MSFLNRERHDHVLVLTMSSPDTRNALTGADQFEDFEATCAEINDDPSVRWVLEKALKQANITTRSFERAEHLLEAIDDDAPDVLITDVRMPGMSGLELQTTLKKKGSQLPVIIITGHGDIPMAVQAMKAGAVDFLEKPYDNDVLVTRIKQCISEASKSQNKTKMIAEAKARLSRLTPREREVMNLLVAGKHNKIIAKEMNISVRTAEAHRAKVMKKLNAESLSDVVRLAMVV